MVIIILIACFSYYYYYYYYYYCYHYHYYYYYNVNPLTALPAKTGSTKLHCLKHCNFFNRASIALTVSQSIGYNRMPFKLGYPEQTQKALFSKYYLLNLDKIKAKMTVLNVIEKRQKSCFLPSGFFSEIIVAKSKVTIHSKIQSLFQSRSDFFCSSLFSGNIASCSNAAWPCLDFQHHRDCSACQEIAILFFFIFVQNILSL